HRRVAIFGDGLARELRPDIGRNRFRLARLGGTDPGGARRQPRDQPIRRRRERYILRMAVDRPCIGLTGNVSRWWGDDEAVMASDIDAGSQRGVGFLLSNDVRYLDSVRAGNQHMFATSAGQHAPRQWDFM